MTVFTASNRRLPGAAQIAALAIAFCSASYMEASSAESAYTTLDLDACVVLEQDEESGGVRLVCDGYDGVPVYVSEGDLRFDVDYGAPNDIWESFGPFNSINDTIEWRVAGARPHAAILRFFLDTGLTGTAADRGEVLVVAKVGAPDAPGCVVALVDAAVEQANGVARGAAAMAPGFACGTQPVAIGPDSSFALSFNNMRPEGQ